MKDKYDFIKYFVEYQQKLMVLNEEQLDVLNEVRPYGDKDIAAAESYIGKIIAELGSEYKIQFSEYKEDIQACHIWRESSLDKMDYRQTCYGEIPRSRKYNKTVSRMIAMYYVFGLELPEWVY